MAKHFENKKYADTKFYLNKLNNIMKKLNIDKYRYRFSDDKAFINFRFNGAWYQINHSIDNARINSPDIESGADIFAELVLTMEDLLHISERNICDFSQWIAPFELKAGAVKLPECFAKLGFDGRYMPSKKNVDYKYNELAKIVDPAQSSFGDKDKFAELQKKRQECYDYIDSLNNEGKNEI